MSKRNAISLALLALAGALAAAPMPAEAAVSDAVILALNSVKLDREADVTGDVVVNDAASAPTLEPGFEFSIDRDGTVDGTVRADSVDIDGKATVPDVECNDGSGACAGLDLPVFQPLPTFRPAVPGDGSGGNCLPQGDCDVGGTQVLPAGAYRDITIASGATLELSGGGYDVASISSSSLATISFGGVTQLRVAGDLQLGDSSTIAATSGLSGRDLVIYVGGDVDIGRSFTGQANFYVEAGLFHLDRDSSLSGSVIAFDADFDKNADLDLDSAFNLAPVADALTVITSGGEANFDLTASDPDGDNLTFTLVSGPSIGSLSGLPASSTASVPVSYTGGTDLVADQFVFKVDDGKGGTDQAVVDINPSDDPPDPPVVSGVLAKDDSAEVVQGATDVAITLVAAAPIAPEPNPIGDLTFAITSGPDQGGTLTTPATIPGPPVRSAEVEYTPLATFTGTESFTFEACDAANPTVCDQGIITIDVLPETPPAPPVAAPQSVATSQATPVEINLAIPAGQEDPSNEGGRDTLCGNGEIDPGEQCDDGNMLNGDGCDDQCNSELL